MFFSLSPPPSPSYNYQQRNTLEFSPFFSADKSCNEENATFPDDSLRNFSPSREPNNEHRIVRVLIIIFRSQTRRIKKKDSKEKRKEGRKEKSMDRRRGDCLGKWTNCASPLFLLREKLDTRDNVSFLLFFPTPPWRERELANNTRNRIVRPSFSSYGDGDGKK